MKPALTQQCSSAGGVDEDASTQAISSESIEKAADDGFAAVIVC